jgi:hypothetical protein
MNNGLVNLVKKYSGGSDANSPVPYCLRNCHHNFVLCLWADILSYLPLRLLISGTGQCVWEYGTGKWAMVLKFTLGPLILTLQKVYGPVSTWQKFIYGPVEISNWKNRLPTWIPVLPMCNSRLKDVQETSNSRPSVHDDFLMSTRRQNRLRETTAWRQ